MVTAQVDRLKAEDCQGKVKMQRILKPCLVQKSKISAEVRQSCFSLPCVAGGEAWVPPLAPCRGVAGSEAWFSLNTFSLTT